MGHIMNKKRIGAAAVLGMLMVWLGCATTSYHQGMENLNDEDYDVAIHFFQKTLQEHPGDIQALRELGVAYYKKGEYETSLQHLLKAFRENPNDLRTLFYMGLTLEEQGRIKHAITAFRRFIALDPRNSMRPEIKVRLTHLLRMKMAADARALLAQEASLDVAALPDGSVAVLNFSNMGNKRGLDPLQKGMADMLITDLSKVKRLKVVERVRMQTLMDEMGLAQTGLVDEGTAPRMGKLLGAATLIKGTFVDLSDYGFRIDAGLVDAKKRTITTNTVEGNLMRLFQLEKDLVFDVVDHMGIPLTQEERDAIEIIPTENILAFMAYCRGLDFQDRGMFEQATQEYRKAIDIDPNFRKARQSLVETETLVKVATPARLERVYAEKTPYRETPTQERRPVAQRSDNLQTTTSTFSLTDHMVRIGSNLNESFLPGIEAREPSVEQSDTGFGNIANFRIS